jgi:hypothetical protein
VQGIIAENIKPTRGDMRPWRVPLAVATVPASPARQTLWRMGRDTPSDTNYWLSWAGRVNVIRGFNASDPTEKTYYTGDGTPKWTDNTKALASAPYPTAWRELGVPKPATAAVLSLTTDGATGTAEDVYALETFVTDAGEESSPGLPSSKVTCKAGALLSLTSLAAAPSGSYGVNRRRIYCTKVGDSATNYYLAAEVAIGTTTVAINTAALNDVLATEGWAMPPADGHSLCALWYGMAAMLSGKSLRFCVPETLYAWPTSYRMLLNDTGVALATFDQTLVVLTTGKPYLIQGQDPQAMSQIPHSIDQACVSARSVVSLGDMVVWASPDGLCNASNAGHGVLTQGIATRDDWQALKPDTMVGFQYEGVYGAFFNDGSGLRALLIDPQNPNGLWFLSTGYEAAVRDPVTDALYVESAGSVQKWDAGASLMTARFKSKVFRQSAPVLYEAFMVVADSFSNMTLKVWADGVLRMTRTVTHGRPTRMPDGFTAKEWQVEIDTTDAVQAIVLATDINELEE